MNGTTIQIRAEGQALATARVRRWNLDGDKLTNADTIYFPRAEFDWPILDEIVCINAEGQVFSRSKLDTVLVVELGFQATIAPGDYEITLLPEEVQ